MKHLVLTFEGPNKDFRIFIKGIFKDIPNFKLGGVVYQRKTNE